MQWNSLGQTAVPDHVTAVWQLSSLQLHLWWPPDPAFPFSFHIHIVLPSSSTPSGPVHYWFRCCYSQPGQHHTLPPPPITTPYVVQSGASHQSCRSHNGHTSISPVLSVAGTLASDLHCLLLYAAPFTLCLSQARSLLFLWYRALLLVIICLSLFFFPFQPLLL